jgi:hypothetical protein
LFIYCIINAAVDWGRRGDMGQEHGRAMSGG